MARSFGFALFAQWTFWASHALEFAWDDWSTIPPDHVLVRKSKKRSQAMMADEAVTAVLAGEIASLNDFFDRACDEPDKRKRATVASGRAITASMQHVLRYLNKMSSVLSETTCRTKQVTLVLRRLSLCVTRNIRKSLGEVYTSKRL